MRFIFMELGFGLASKSMLNRELRDLSELKINVSQNYYYNGFGKWACGKMVL
jgi:hypothetical protein